MSLIGDFMNISRMGEPARLDYAIREHDELKARFEKLVRLLEAKGVLTRDERVGLLPPPEGLQLLADAPSVSEPDPAS